MFHTHSTDRQQKFVTYSADALLGTHLGRHGPHGSIRLELFHKCFRDRSRREHPPQCPLGHSVEFSRRGSRFRPLDLKALPLNNSWMITHERRPSRLLQPLGFPKFLSGDWGMFVTGWLNSFSHCDRAQPYPTPLESQNERPLANSLVHLIWHLANQFLKVIFVYNKK